MDQTQYEKIITLLADYNVHGETVWKWRLFDMLGIKREGNITPKFYKVYHSLDISIPEAAKLKYLMEEVPGANKQLLEDPANCLKEEDQNEGDKNYKVDSVDSFYEEKVHKIAKKLYNAEFNLYLYGPAGCGKTTFATLLSPKHELISCHSGTRPSHLLGHIEVVDGKTGYVYGPLLTAMEQGMLLILDEFDRVQEDVAAVLHQVLETRRIFVEYINKEIVAKKGFQIVATGNSEMQGSSEYNTNSLDYASIDRFEFIQFGYTRFEKQIMINYGVEPGFAENFLKVVDLIRKGSYTLPFSTRRIISISRMLRAQFSFQDALQISYLSRIQEDEAKEVKSLFQTLASLGKKSAIWSFKQNVPESIIEKLSVYLSPSEEKIFRKTKSCVVNEKITTAINQGFIKEEDFSEYFAQTIKIQEGVEVNELIPS